MADAASLVTFLVTDIEGSSLKWLNHRMAIQAALAAHDRIFPMSAMRSSRGGWWRHFRFRSGGTKAGIWCTAPCVRPIKGYSRSALGSIAKPNGNAWSMSAWFHTRRTANEHCQFESCPAHSFGVCTTKSARPVSGVGYPLDSRRWA